MTITLSNGTKLQEYKLPTGEVAAYALRDERRLTMAELAEYAEMIGTLSLNDQRNREQSMVLEGAKQ